MKVDEYLKKLCEYCGADSEKVEISVEEVGEDDAKRLELAMTMPEEDVSLFIGSRGETLESIEQMIKTLFHEEYSEHRIILDINGYKKEREEKLREKAITIAYQVLDSGRQYVFPYLNSYERYLVHSAISSEDGLEDIETFSEDEEDRRVLVIQVKNSENFENSEEEKAENNLDENE